MRTSLCAALGSQCRGGGHKAARHWRAGRNLALESGTHFCSSPETWVKGACLLSCVENGDKTSAVKFLRMKGNRVKCVKRAVESCRNAGIFSY